MIIGISGRKQNGKDAVCSIIQLLTRKSDLETDSDTKHWDDEMYSIIRMMPNRDWDELFTWKRKIFAGKLKQTVALILGCTIDQLENEEFKNKPLGQQWDRWVTYVYDSMIDIEVRDKVFSSEIEAYNNSSHVPYNVTIKREQITPRIILQELGTEGMRNIHPDFHVHALFADYKPIGYTDGWLPSYYDPDNSGCVPAAEPIYPKWIIPDVRFPNEVEAIRKLGGLVIRVENPRIKSTDQHPSETSLDDFKDWDWKILNDGSIDDLINKTRDFLYTKNLI